MTELPIETLIARIRTSFRLLQNGGDMLFGDLGMTTSMRGVLKGLDRDGAQTVSQMARAKRVRRQHIQTLANRLSESGYIAFVDNPGDRRAPLMTLTPKGRNVFEEIRGREVEVFTCLAEQMGDQDIHKALSALDAFEKALQAEYSAVGADEIERVKAKRGA